MLQKQRSGNVVYAWGRAQVPPHFFVLLFLLVIPAKAGIQ